ncbi:10498_t:CDS:2 [Entrophospora sp. SA101]|nr:2987_t:CDS:2 [Entrophospora sp. SA101]CAJ0760692.1 10498_t:CDS:2 [Entrophospora sp. SA101]CAJ0887576.1 5504_t:CDS:2 [Entrophospora sp. SA101]
MKDVIENVKKDFKDSGIDETVLHELEHNWLQKLKSFKVASWNHNDGNVGEETNGSTTNYPPNPNEFETPPPAAANLPTLATSTLSSHIKKFQSYTTYPDTYEKKRKDSITKRKLYVEDDINSDLDDSDEDEGAAEGEFQNIILCLYDKVK